MVLESARGQKSVGSRIRYLVKLHLLQKSEMLRGDFVHSVSKNLLLRGVSGKAPPEARARAPGRSTDVVSWCK